MVHSETYLQLKWVVEHPNGYDPRDVIAAKKYCEAYEDGYKRSPAQVKTVYWDKLVEELSKFAESYDEEGNKIPPERDGDLTDIGQIAWDLTGLSGIERSVILNKYFNKIK